MALLHVKNQTMRRDGTATRLESAIEKGGTAARLESAIEKGVALLHV